MVKLNSRPVLISRPMYGRFGDRVLNAINS